MENLKVKLNWKSVFFSNMINITENSKKIGFLKSDAFSYITKLEINKNKYEFIKEGFLSNAFIIKNCATNKKVGEIKFEAFKTQSTIKLEGKEYIWKQKEFWKSNYILTLNNKVISTYSSKFSGGQIEAINDDYLLLFTGLYTTVYYLKTLFLFFIVILTPIIIN